MALHSELMRDALHKERITQKKMAQKMGWKSSQFVSNICHGKSLIPPAKFKRFSRLTGTSIVTLIEAHFEAKRQKVQTKAGGK